MEVATNTEVEPNPAIAEANEVALVALELFGSESEAVRAVLRAIDSGYTFDQLAEGIRSSALNDDGTIVGVQPASPSGDLIIGFRQVPVEPVSIDEAEQAAIDLAKAKNAIAGLLASEANVLALVLVVAALGYTPEQVIFGLFAGFEVDDYDDIGYVAGECDLDNRYYDKGDCDWFEDECEPFLIIDGDSVPRPDCPDPDRYDDYDDDEDADADAEPDIGSTAGAWTGSGTSTDSSESRSTTYAGSAVVELRDGVHTLSFEMDSQSTTFGHDGCSTTTSAFGQIDGTPDGYGQILFVAEVTTDIVSDFLFYESSGGVATETNERTFVGRLRDDGVFVLEHLVPDSSVELVWTPL